MKVFVVIAAVLLAVVPGLKAEATQPKLTKAGDLQPLQTEINSIVADINQPAPIEESSQMPAVSQLSDVQPGDWAFESLRNLVERYACISGYPDGKFLGNRALTRYEFAAGLNSCLEKVTEIIRSATSNYATQEDLAQLQRLQTEFAAELASLRGRVDSLEERISKLEEQTMTPTAILGGEAIFGLTGSAGGNPPGRRSEPNFTYLTRLGVVSTFTGKDRLRLELSSGNFEGRGLASPDVFNTDMALLSYQGGTSNQVQLDKVEYRFAAFDDRVVFTLRPVGFSLSTVLTANSPYFDAGRGALSRFAEASPLFKIGNLDAGLGFDWLVTDRLRLQVAYGTGDSNISERGKGVFGADRSALGVQLLAKPVDNVLTGLGYINAYSSEGRLDTFTGSFISDTNGFLNQPAEIQALSGTLQWRINRKITLGSWGGWIFSNSTVSDASATTTTYLFSVGISDPFGREGDLLAFLFGQPPKLVRGNNLFLGEDEATSLHLEGFYRFRVTDNIWITPGFFVVFNPEHNSNNNEIFVGTVRTTFRF
jgi:hypothetical protein